MNGNRATAASGDGFTRHAANAAIPANTTEATTTGIARFHSGRWTLTVRA